MITRAADAPLPPELASRMAAPLIHLSRATVAFLSDSAAAFRDRKVAPDLAGVAGAMAEYGAAFAALRQAGTVPLGTAEQGTVQQATGQADGAPGRLFALGFALEQLSENLRDLSSRVNELAQTRR